MAHMMLTLCAIGCTGVGKSSLCNLLSGRSGTGGGGGCDAPGGFGVSSGIDACTEQTMTGVHKWLGTGEPVKLIDTPGLGDPQGRDSHHIAEMVKHLKEVGHVNAFLLVLNSQVPRLDEYMRANLAIFKDIFGGDFFSHVILVFTRWGYDPRSIRDRERDGITKEKKQEEMNQFLNEQYDISHTIPAVFLDNFPDWEDPTEEEMTNKELQTLKDLASAMSPFSCQEAEARRGHVDELETQEEAERTRREAAEAEAKRLGELVDEEMANREEDRKKHDEKKKQQELILEREFQQKEEQRRTEARERYTEKKRLRQFNRVKDWTLVPCPGGDVPTWRPDLILCGPGNKVTIQEGGNINPRPPDWDPVWAAEGLTFYAEGKDWVINDFSEFEIKLDFLGEPLHITFKKD